MNESHFRRLPEVRAQPAPCASETEFDGGKIPQFLYEESDGGVLDVVGGAVSVLPIWKAYEH